MSTDPLFSIIRASHINLVPIANFRQIEFILFYYKLFAFRKQILI